MEVELSSFQIYDRMSGYEFPRFFIRDYTRPSLIEPGSRYYIEDCSLFRYNGTGAGVVKYYIDIEVISLTSFPFTLWAQRNIFRSSRPAMSTDI